MRLTEIRVIEALFTLLRKGIENVYEYNKQYPDFPLDEDIVKSYMIKWTLMCLNWAFVGDTKLQKRERYFSALKDN